jgi:hypothetical protein
VGMLRQRTTLLFLLSGGMIPTASAQESVVDTLTRAGICARAAQRLQQGVSGQAYFGAVAALPYCPATGGQVLRQQWEHPPSDTVEQRVLGEVTPRLRDHQVFEAVLRVFRDPSRPRELRLAALRALMGYYQPGLKASFVDREVQVDYGGAYVLMGRGDSTTTPSRSAPLTAGSRGEILQAIKQVAAQDPDKRVRLIAAYIHDRLVGMS